MIFDVVPYEGRWRVLRDGRLDSEHDTQDQATLTARQRAEANAPSEVLVHTLDGEIHSISSYRDRPFPRRPHEDQDPDQDDDQSN
ncbi:DUF2188 domain-containing protein [Microlunatus elymi]|nr:DUF2188 domain-containing protein [Microlunatus elymi]